MKKSFIFAILIAFTLVLPLNGFLFVGEKTFDSPDTSNHLNTGIIPKVASEEENIDSFEVNPKSGRWDNTADSNVIDTIANGQLDLLAVNNDTSTTANFAIEREMRKSDGKIEYRSQADGGGNQTEWGRDYRGDALDFEEGDVEVFTTGTVSNGVLSNSGTSFITFAWIASEFGVNLEIYHTLDIILKTNVSGKTLGIAYRTPDMLDASQCLGDTVIGTTTGQWQQTSTSISNSNCELVKIAFYVNAGGDAVLFEIEDVKLIGDLDFATSVEGEISDSWDWEDSLEYWYDVEDNISDFNDGSLEGWDTVLGATTVTNVNNQLFLERNNDDIRINNSISLDASQYIWFTAEIYSELHDIDIINVVDADINVVCNDHTDLDKQEWHLFNCDMTDAGWTGTETTIEFQVFFADGNNPQELTINSTFIYDSQFGDLEGYAFLERMHVNPSGYLTGTAGAGVAATLRSPTGLTINPTLFDYFSISMRALSDIRVLFRVYDGSGFMTIKDTFDLDMSSSFSTTNIDLSTNSAYKALTNVEYFDFVLTDKTGEGDLDGNETLHVDFVFILGHFDTVSSTIGLSDPDGSPVLNVSTVFYGNNTERFEIKLMDSYGNIAYSYDSDFYTALGQEFIRGKIAYNTLKSTLIITLTWDNSTRIFRVSWDTTGDDYTAVSGLTPALFDIPVGPMVFVSTYTPVFSWQSLLLDFVKAPFKERKWIQTDVSSESEVIFSSPLLTKWDITAGSRLGGTPFSLDTWQLTVPYLDAFSGKMVLVNNDTSTTDAEDLSIYKLTVYNVEWDTGDLVEVLNLVIAAGTDTTGWNTPRIITEDPIAGFETYDTGADDADLLPAVHFSFDLSDDRERIDIVTRQYLNGSDETVFQDKAQNIDITAINAKSSQEFVIEFSTYAQGGQFWDIGAQIFKVEDWDLVERDILLDVINLITPGETWSGDWNPFAAFFRFLAEVIKAMGDAFTFAFVNAIAGLQTFVGPLFTSLEATIAAEIAKIEGWLITLGTTITTSLNTGFANVVTAVNNVKTAVNNIEAWLTTTATTIVNAINNIETWLTTLKDTLVTAIANIEGYINAIEAWINNIENWLITLGVDLLATLDPILTAIGNIWAWIQAFVNVFLAALLTWIEASLWTLFTGTLFILFWNVLIGIVQSFVDAVLLWVLGVFNATALWIEAGDFITFLLSIIFLLYAFCVFILFSSWIIAAREPEDIFRNGWDVISFDITFGISLLGFRLYVPYGLFMLVWTIALGYATTLFPAAVPW